MLCLNKETTFQNMTGAVLLRYGSTPVANDAGIWAQIQVRTPTLRAAVVFREIGAGVNLGNPFDLQLHSTDAEEGFPS